MGSLWIKEFRSGLDTRRMPATAPGGVLIEALNGHINRGGEFEQRAAFVPLHELPAGKTTGLTSTRNGLVVFSSEDNFTMPNGVTCVKLFNEGKKLTRVLSEDQYAGKLYVVAQYEDASIKHFYDGVEVVDWFDGRARATFEIGGNGGAPGVQASGRLEITAGTNSPGTNQVVNVRVNSIVITANPVDHTGDNTTTATAVAQSINNGTAAYTATAAGAIITIKAVQPGASRNGFVVTTILSGDVATNTIQSMAGGVDQVVSSVQNVIVDGTSLISNPVPWAGTPAATAEDLANAINQHISAPDYSATSSGPRVNIIKVAAGAEGNDLPTTVQVFGGLTATPDNLMLTNGADSESGYTPGTFVKTIGSKVYSVSGPNLHFSGIQAPTKWKTDTVGAGFIDMSSQSSGAEQLTALAEYQDRLAVFAEQAIVIYYIDPDPDLNKRLQTLSNTGTESPRSVTQFGDADIFYLDESGLRSIRARDSSLAAATEDVGVPVDTYVTSVLESMSSVERQAITGVIEPRDGRFWLSMKDLIFVFSYFPGSETSAWSVYRPSWNGVEFPVDNMVSNSRKVFVRSGDKIYVYGGPGDELIHDTTVARARLPFLDANTPTRKKEWQGVDAALEGRWDILLSFDPNNMTVVDKIASLDETTFGDGQIPAIGISTHVGVVLQSVGKGPHKVSSVVLTFRGGEDEDK